MGEKGNAAEALSSGAVSGGGLPGIEISAPGVEVTIGGVKREEAAPEKCSNCGAGLEGRDVCATCGLNWRTGEYESTDTETT